MLSVNHGRIDRKGSLENETDAMAYLDVSCITSWHAHVCFDAASRDPAREFREAVTAQFDGAGGDKSIQANCSGWLRPAQVPIRPAPRTSRKGSQLFRL